MRCQGLEVERCFGGAANKNYVYMYMLRIITPALILLCRMYSAVYIIRTLSLVDVVDRGQYLVVA